MNAVNHTFQLVFEAHHLSSQEGVILKNLVAEVTSQLASMVVEGGQTCMAQ